MKKALMVLLAVLLAVVVNVPVLAEGESPLPVLRVGAQTDAEAGETISVTLEVTGNPSGGKVVEVYLPGPTVTGVIVLDRGVTVHKPKRDGNWKVSWVPRPWRSNEPQRVTVEVKLTQDVGTFSLLSATDPWSGEVTSLDVNVFAPSLDWAILFPQPVVVGEQFTLLYTVNNRHSFPLAYDQLIRFNPACVQVVSVRRGNKAIVPNGESYLLSGHLKLGQTARWKMELVFVGGFNCQFLNVVDSQNGELSYYLPW